jgi:hypothetical protein
MWIEALRGTCTAVLYCGLSMVLIRGVNNAHEGPNISDRLMATLDSLNGVDN